jgi:hypothetical protein
MSGSIRGVGGFAVKFGRLRAAAICGALVFCVPVTAAVFAGQASASTFLGNTIDACAGFSSGPCGTAGNAVESSHVQAVVGAGIEFSNGQFGAFHGPSFDFDSTTITITTASVGHSGGTFNGYSFFDVFASIDPITGVTVQSDNTGLFSGDPSRITFDPNTIFVNFQGLSFNSDAVIVLAASFGPSTTTPLPAALPLFTTGLGALGLLGWRRKRKAQAAA